MQHQLATGVSRLLVGIIVVGVLSCCLAMSGCSSSEDAKKPATASPQEERFGRLSAKQKAAGQPGGRQVGR